MKSLAKNTIGYSGLVTLYQYVGKKKIKVLEAHNAGATPLFNFLSDCLIGDFEEANLERPAKVMLLNKAEGTYTAASGFIYLINKPEKIAAKDNIEKGIVKYSFMISRDTLLNTAFNAIGLYADNTTRPDGFAAVVDVDTDTEVLTNSSYLLVDWQLTIQNTTLGGTD